MARRVPLSCASAMSLPVLSERAVASSTPSVIGIDHGAPDARRMLSRLL